MTHSSPWPARVTAVRKKMLRLADVSGLSTLLQSGGIMALRLSILAFAALGLWACTQSGVRSEAAPRCEDIGKTKCTSRLGTGITMAYLEAGQANGEAVLLLHGLTDSARSWSIVMQTLRETQPGLHIFALDLRGHGETTMPDPAHCRNAPEMCFRMSDFADDIVAFMEAKHVAKATFAGHSMGSFVAQEMALAHPEMVDRIVLVATSTKVAGNASVRDFVLNEPVEGAWKKALEARGISYPAGAYDLMPRDADANIEDWLSKNWADPVADSVLLKAIVGETARLKLGTWIGATKALLATDNTERLKSLGVPALVLWGAQDDTFRSTDQGAIRSVLDAAAASGKTSYSWKQYGVIPLSASGAQENDIGHNIPWEVPKEIATDIASFIETGRPTPDLYRTDAPNNNITKIVTETGKAIIVQRP